MRNKPIKEGFKICTLNGNKVHLAVETDYPFRDTVHIKVAPAKKAAFPMLLRIPAWADGATIKVNGRDASVAAKPGTFARVERTWQQGDTIELRFPMMPTVTRGFRQSLTLVRGPIVFSLDPGETWVKLRDRKPTADWQVFPQRSWNYALAIDEHSAKGLKVEVSEVGAKPFAAEGTPIQIHVPGRLLNSWRSADGVANPVPDGPQASNEPEEMLKLIPYGAAKLRVTAFPQLKTT